MIKRNRRGRKRARRENVRQLMSIISYVWNWIILSAFWKKKREFDPLLQQREAFVLTTLSMMMLMMRCVDFLVIRRHRRYFLSIHHIARPTFLLLFTIHFHPHTSSSDRRECVSVKFTLSAHISCGDDGGISYFSHPKAAHHQRRQWERARHSVQYGTHWRKKHNKQRVEA